MITSAGFRYGGNPSSPTRLSVRLWSRTSMPIGGPHVGCHFVTGVVVRSTTRLPGSICLFRPSLGVHHWYKFALKSLYIHFTIYIHHYHIQVYPVNTLVKYITMELSIARITGANPITMQCTKKREIRVRFTRHIFI